MSWHDLHALPIGRRILCHFHCRNALGATLHQFIGTCVIVPTGHGSKFVLSRALAGLADFG
jgi:hypothetical protein